MEHKAFVYCSAHMMGLILHSPLECATKIKSSFFLPYSVLSGILGCNLYIYKKKYFISCYLFFSL